MYLSSMIPDWLAWLMDEKSLAFATWGLVFATVALVLATLFLFLDSRRHGKDQVERWQREDRLREAAARPSAIVELGKSPKSPDVIVLCYNLGEHPFVIDKLVVVVPPSTHIWELQGPHVVQPGNYYRVPLHGGQLVSRNEPTDATVVFYLKGTSGTIPTEPVAFHLLPDGAGGYDWRMGSLAHKLPGTTVQVPRELFD